MRLLVSTPWFPTEDQPHSGIFVAQQVEALRKRFDVAVLHLDIGSEGSRPQIGLHGDMPVVRATARVGTDLPGKLGDIQVFRQLMSGIERAALQSAHVLESVWGRPDLTHAHVIFPSAIVANSIARCAAVPYVVTEHSASFMSGFTDWAWAGKRVDRMIHQSVAGASRLISVSSAQARALSDFGFGDGCTVVPNVIPVTGDASPYPETTPKRILHVSLMREVHKNIDMLLHAVAFLRLGRADFELVLVGDGPDRRMLEGRAKSMGLLDTAVRFAGSVENERLLGMFAGSCFSVVSSRVETFCVAAAESLACGRPVVSTRCGGPEDYLDDTTGRLIANDDAHAMKAGLEWMLDNYVTFAPDLLQARARELFSEQSVMDQLASIYAAASDPPERS